MDYKVVVTSDAEEDLDRFLQYLLFEKKNEPAAGNILDDFGDTLNCLKNVAGSLSLCENQRLRALGYHRINFLRHRYFMLYRIEENTVFIDDIFFSYDRDDEYVRNFMVKTSEKGAKTVVAMLGEYGSLAYENGKFYKLDAEKVEVVNTVGAGDSYIAAFTYGVSLGEDIMQCMRRGRQRATEIIQQFNPYK